jgi:fibronectin type 3 domain-containing protein
MAIFKLHEHLTNRTHLKFITVIITLMMITSGVLFLPTSESKTGGPDSFGYRWIDSVAPTNISYNWIDIVGSGTDLNLENDKNSGFKSLGFKFPYYSSSYTKIAVCDNGWASFLYTSTTKFDTIPSYSAPNAVIAPFWLDLDPSMYSTGGKVFYQRFNTTSPKHFVITWDSIPIYMTGSIPYHYNNTFQAVIYENGSILFQYKAVNTTNTFIPIVGIENNNGNIGLQYLTPLKNKTAVMFYYNYPEHDVLVKNLDLPEIGLLNEDIKVKATVQNFGLSDETNLNVTLKVNTQLVNWTVFDLDAFSQQDVQFTWRPAVANNYSVEIAVKPVNGETNTANNKLNRNLDVRKWRLIAFDRTHNWWSMGNFIEWFDDLRQYNYYVEEFNSEPITTEKLSRYELILFIGPSQSFSVDELTAIQTYLAAGHGMLVIGYSSYITYLNSLTQPYEITWENYDGWGGTSTNIIPHEITINVTSVYVNSPRCQLKFTGAAKGLVYDTSVTPNGFILGIANESTPERVAAYSDIYGFVDWAYNRANNKAMSHQLIQWVAGDHKAPAKPKGFSVSNGKVGNQLNLSWSANGEIDLHGYHIYRGTSPGDYGTTPIAYVPKEDTKYYDTGLEDGTKYYYTIAAVDEVPNISILSAEKSGTPTDILPPITPSNITIADVGTGLALNLSWNFNPENDVVSYNIYKTDNLNTQFTTPNIIVSSDVNHYFDTDVIEGKTYYYSFSAEDEVPNESYLTLIRGGTPYDRIAPKKPKNFKVEDSGLGNTLTLTWDHNSEDDLFDYLIERRDTKGNIKRMTVRAPANIYNDTKLNDGFTYSYRLYARDDTKLNTPNKSPATPWASGIPTDKTPPEPPQNFTIIDESYSTGVEYIQCLRLQWNFGNDSDLRGYKVYKDDAPLFPILENKLIADVGLTNYYTDYDVIEGEAYYYKITAYDEVPMESWPSEELKAIPKDVTPPPIPIGFLAIAEPEGNEISFSWDLLIDPDIAGYALHYSTNQSEDFELVAKFDKSVNEFKHKNLIDDQLYYYKLQSYDANAIPNYSPFTAVISITPSDILPPEPPSGLRLQKLDEGSSLLLTWKPSDSEDDDLAGYRVYRMTENVPYTMVMAVDKDTNSVIDTYLVNGKSYKYYVTAIDEVPNESEGSVEKELMPEDSIEPYPPGEVTIKLSDNKDSIVLSWEPSNSSDVYSYRIFRSLDGKNFKKYADIPFSEGSYTDNEVNLGKKYYYQVAALDQTPNISPRTDTVSLEVPEKESELDTSLVTNLFLIIIVIIIILAFAGFMVKRRSRKQKDKEMESEKSMAKKPGQVPEEPKKPAVEIPGLMAVDLEGAPVPTRPAPTSTQVIRPVTPLIPPSPSVGAPGVDAASLKKPEEVPKLLPKLVDVPSKTSKTLEPSEPMEEPEPEVEPYMEDESVLEAEVEDTEGTMAFEDAWGKDVGQEIEPEPTPAPIPITPPTPAPIPPPVPVTEPVMELPIILVPVDNEDVGKELEDKSKQKGPYRKQEPVTILNPLLHNVRQFPLRQPPVGKVVEPMPKTQKPQKTYPTKVPQQTTPPKQVKQEVTSEDEIKKLLRKYMKSDE